MCAGWLQGFGAEMSVMADFPLNTYLMKHDRKWRLSSWRAGKWDACPFVSLTSLQSLTLEKSQCLGKLFTSTIKLPISQQAEDKGMKVFFSLSKVTPWLFTFQPALFGLWPMAGSRPSHQSQRGDPSLVISPGQWAVPPWNANEHIENQGQNTARKAQKCNWPLSAFARHSRLIDRRKSCQREPKVPPSKVQLDHYLQMVSSL